MQWFSELSLKIKITLLIIIGGGSVAVLLYENHLFINSAVQQRKALKNSELPVLRISNHLQLNFNKMNERYQLAVLEGNVGFAIQANDIAVDMLTELKRIPRLLPVLRPHTDILQEELSEYSHRLDRFVISVLGQSSEKYAPDYDDSETQLSREAVAVQREKKKVGRKLIEFSGMLEFRLAERTRIILLEGERITRRDVMVGSWVLVLIVLLAVWFARLITESIENGISIANDIGRGRWDINIKIETNSHNEMGRLGHALKTMRNSLREQNQKNRVKDLVLYRSSKLNEVLRGELSLEELASRVLINMNQEVDSLVGAFYELVDGQLNLISSYAYRSLISKDVSFKLGESLVGQCGLEKKAILVDDVPEGYMEISAGIGSLNANHLFLVPLLHNDVVKGVLELGVFDPFPSDALAFIEKGAEGIAIAVHSVQSRVQLNKMLLTTRMQTQTLESQQEELKTANEELEKQAQVLRVSEGNLQAQQEELKVLNEELEERSRLLDERNTIILEKNKALEESRDVNKKDSSKDAGSIKTDNRQRELDPGLLMIVEDDAKFSAVLEEVANEFCVKSVLMRCAEDAVDYIKLKVPAAIILDMGLPGMSGDEFIEYLNDDMLLKNIPVHVLSGSTASENAINLGAVNYLHKPVRHDKINLLFSQIKNDLSVSIKRLLIIEDDVVQGDALREKFADHAAEVDLVVSGHETKAILESKDYDCIVLDLNLADCDGLTLLKELRMMKKVRNTPIIIYTAMDVSVDLEKKLTQYADRIILKAGTGMRRVHDEAALFLNWVGLQRTETVIENRDTKHSINEGSKNEKFDRGEVTNSAAMRDSDASSPLEGKRVLLVDDDARNLYSLTAILEECGMSLDTAMNGKEAVDKILGDVSVNAGKDDNRNRAYDLVLMDIMMPEMDGYEAIRIIRSKNEFNDLPIIAVTAKAMNEDRIKCLEVGANDYLTKPVNVKKLIGIIKVWLGKAG